MKTKLTLNLKEMNNQGYQFTQGKRTPFRGGVVRLVSCTQKVVQKISKMTFLDIGKRRWLWFN